jgi:O-antigen ligase
VFVALRIRARRGTLAAVGTSLVLVLAGGAAWSTVAAPAVRSLQHTDHSLLRYSVARSSRSAEGRESLFAASYELYQTSEVVGIGPSATRRSLAETGIHDAKEAHNDYLGTLVERGPPGVVALLALMVAVAARIVSAQRPPPGWSAVVPRPEALAAVAVAYAFTSLTHEVLHYRHLWTLLAVVAALHLATRDRAAPSERVTEASGAG